MRAYIHIVHPGEFNKRDSTHLEARAVGVGGGDEVEQGGQVRQAVQPLCGG